MTIVAKPSQDTVIVACGSNKFSSHKTIVLFEHEETVKDTQTKAA